MQARTARDGWRDAEEPRLALVGGGRRSMAAAAGRSGGSAIVELATRRSARPDGRANGADGGATGTCK